MDNELLLWNNEENNFFYEKVNADGLKKLSIKAGILSGCDVLSVKKYWQDAGTILDACSGFGRVPVVLNKNGFTGSLVALERSAQQFVELDRCCSDYATTIHGDIYFLKTLKAKFDVIFLLWSGLADFPSQQQQEIVSLLADVLQLGGKIIIDTMPMDTQPLDTEKFNQRSFLTKAGGSVVKTYEPTDKEIAEYAKASGLSIVDVEYCKTDTDRVRWLYILS